MRLFHSDYRFDDIIQNINFRRNLLLNRDNVNRLRISNKFNLQDDNIKRLMKNHMKIRFGLEDVLPIMIVAVPSVMKI